MDRLFFCERKHGKDNDAVEHYIFFFFNFSLSY